MQSFMNITVFCEYKKCSHQKLGIIWENKVFYKVNFVKDVKEWTPKFRFLNEKKKSERFRQLLTENSLWKSDFTTIDKPQSFSLGMWIFPQKSS